MSHNSKSYRKKIDAKTSSKCKKIDLLFKQNLLSASVEREASPTVSGKSNVQTEPDVPTQVLPASAQSEDEDITDQYEVPEEEETFSSSSLDATVFVPDNRKFDTVRYEREHPWLYYSAAKTGYCCKYCECYFRNPPIDQAYVSRGVSLGTHPGRKLADHEVSQAHRRSAQKYFMPAKMSVAEQIKQQAVTVDANKDKIASNYVEVLFKSAYYIAKKHWAVGENLDDFVKNFLGGCLHVDGVTKYLEIHPQITYTSPSSVQDIMGSLSLVFEEEVLTKLRAASCYALMADESTDESNRNQFAIVAKFLFNGKVTDVFLGLVRVTSATAENLMAAIEHFLVTKEIPVEKALLVGFDGCNTMSGEKKGLQRRFRHLVPHQIYVHCRNHRLALCVKHLVKEYPILNELDEVLLSIWKLFNYSPKRFAVFENVQESYGLPKMTMIKAVSTRWLSHGRACRRLLDRFEAILDTLDELYDAKREPEIYGLRQMLASKKMVAAAAVVCDMLAPVCILSDYLQGDVHFTHVNEKVKDLVDQLTELAESSD